MKLFCWNNYVKTEAWKHSINLKNASIICWSLVPGSVCVFMCVCVCDAIPFLVRWSSYSSYAAVGAEANAGKVLLLECVITGSPTFISQ